MSLLFLKSPLNLQELSSAISDYLGGQVALEGDSANVAGGIYFVDKLLGLKLKLEINSYDYEDEYNYMLAISKDATSDFMFDHELEEMTTKVLGKLLAKNLNMIIAQEKGEELMLLSYL